MASEWVGGWVGGGVDEEAGGLAAGFVGERREAGSEASERGRFREGGGGNGLGIEEREGEVEGWKGKRGSGAAWPLSGGPGSDVLDRARRRHPPGSRLMGLTVSTVPWLPATAK